jgi:hypothetical protein
MVKGCKINTGRSVTSDPLPNIKHNLFSEYGDYVGMDITAEPKTPGVPWCSEFFCSKY